MNQAACWYRAALRAMGPTVMSARERADLAGALPDARVAMSGAGEEDYLQAVQGEWPVVEVAGAAGSAQVGRGPGGAGQFGEAASLLVGAAGELDVV